jgi:transaldolase
VPRRLSIEVAREADVERIELDEEAFRWRLNEDAMATEKLAEGIRRFHADSGKLVEFALDLARRGTG